MKKKLLSLLMATAMILSLAVPALAVDYYDHPSTADDKTSQPVTFDAKTFVPTIKLSVPNITSDPMILNPYKIEYTGTGTEGQLNGKSVVSADSQHQIICPIYSIKNETNAKMNVSVSATTTVTQGVTLATTHVEPDVTTKQAYLQLVVKKVSVTSAPAIDNAAAYDKLDAYDAANNETIVMSATNAAQKVAVMANAATTPNYLLFQFTGELSRQPNEAWKSNDKVKSVVTFTFSPISGVDTTGATNAAAALSAIPKADQTDAKTFTMPKQANGAYTANGVAADTTVTSWTGDNMGLSQTDPKWKVVDGGVLGMTISGSVSDGYSASIPATGLNKLPKDGQQHSYVTVVSFRDKNEVPRTMELTLNITRLS